jgi:hypothetical protein
VEEGEFNCCFSFNLREGRIEFTNDEFSRSSRALQTESINFITSELKHTPFFITHRHTLNTPYSFSSLNGHSPIEGGGEGEEEEEGDGEEEEEESEEEDEEEKEEAEEEGLNEEGEEEEEEEEEEEQQEGKSQQ